MYYKYDKMSRKRSGLLPKL